MKSHCKSILFIIVVLFFVINYQSIFAQSIDTRIELDEIRIGTQVVTGAEYRTESEFAFENSGVFYLDNYDLGASLNFIFNSKSNFNYYFGISYNELGNAEPSDHAVHAHLMSSDFGIMKRVGSKYFGIEPNIGVGVCNISSTVESNDSNNPAFYPQNAIGLSISMGINAYINYRNITLYPNFRYRLVGNSDIAVFYLPVGLSIGYSL